MKNLFEYLISKKNKSKIKIPKTKQSKMIPFEDVNPGMEGLTYSGEPGVITWCGTADEMYWMDQTGALQDLIDDKEILPDDPAVIVDLDSGEKDIGYVYGVDGFACYK